MQSQEGIFYTAKKMKLTKKPQIKPYMPSVNILSHSLKKEIM